MALTGDLLRALGQLGDRRFLWVLVKALLLTLTLLAAFAGVLVWLFSLIPTDLGEWWLIGRVTLPSFVLTDLAIWTAIWISPFLMLPVTAMFVGLFVDEIIEAVEERHYAGTAARCRVRLFEALGEALKFLTVLVIVNLFALFFYIFLLLFVGPLAILVFWAVNGYLIGREYLEMVTIHHLDPRAAAAFRWRHFWSMWGAGAAMVGALAVPVANVLVPVLGAAMVTHMFHRLRAAETAAG